jgi:flagellar biosynthetic protein FliR
MELTLTQILSPLLLIGLRVSGLMLFAPFVGNSVVPPRIKIGLVIGITAALYPVYSSALSKLALPRWPIVVASEMLIGIAMGLTTNLVFEAAQMAGQLLSIQMGYSLVNILDPTTQVDTTVVGVFYQTVAMLIFLQLNVHHWIIRAIAKSFDYLPPGTATINPMFAETVLREGAMLLELGVQVAAPVLAATLLADLVLGLLGKASPHLPVMLLGTALKSLLGLVLIVATMQFWPALFERHFAESIAYTEKLLHLAR